MTAFRRSASAPVVPWDSEQTIRGELFSGERLEQHAETLAAAQPVTARPRRVRSLADRLLENERVLIESHRMIADVVAVGGAITPSAEWVLDNMHIVEEQVREIRDDLPPRFYRQLPKLADGPFAGYPRILGVAWAFVAHTDSRFDPELLSRFLRAYQRVQPLSIGELWATAITLRMVLVENLRRAARRIVISREQRAEADALAHRLLAADAQDGDGWRILERYRHTPLPPAFAVELVHRLRDQDVQASRALAWLEEHLRAQGSSIDRVVHDEHQSQGGTNVTVRNIITSMRFLSEIDWADIFENVSLVDAVLRRSRTFDAMDFATRNLYRNAVEELARGSGTAEIAVAEAAIEFDPADLATIAGDAVEDPGYRLIGPGRRKLERSIGYRAPVRVWPRRFNAALGIRGLVLVSILLAAVLLSVPLVALDTIGMATWQLVLLALLGALPALDAAILLVNSTITREVHATTLPALELRDGVPQDMRTLIAVPTLLTDLADVEAQLSRLEVHYLASGEGDLYFALLSDWTDAAAESMPDDASLLAAAADGVARLNARHGHENGGERFMLLHRRRVWNEGQRRWIGWERKRGKLHELNRLLRGDRDTTFIDVAGRPPMVPDSVRFVITLDSDTRLPKDTARRLIGKLAHPLNRPRFDATTRRVVQGYGVLQPRVTPALPVGREASVFQRVFSSASGIDPYAFAVSDVYQDLFGEGSYTGKGIYDIDAFEGALEGRVPDNAVLSHDLFEGTFARAGFVSDVELIEDFPSRYDAAAARQHRWVRGDWQLLPWLIGLARARVIERRAAAVPRIGRLKMVDNLRRSVTVPAAVIALFAGWTLAPRNAAIWTVFVLVTIALPMLVPAISGLRRTRRGAALSTHLRAIGRDFGLAGTRIVLLTTLLAHQAWLLVDAIARTLFRMFVSHRHLLDWVTAAQAAKRTGTQRWHGAYRRMAGGVGVVAAGCAIIAFAGAAWPVAAPVLILWLLAPAVATWISRPPDTGERALDEADAKYLREIGRRTWRFFETFVTEGDRWLPPDNFQETPEPAVARRTSPTNIGLYLLSVVAARDFGWIGTREALVRLERTLATMQELPRFRGHFYNWYGTADLRVLDPPYISSVDSGNLAGHLIVVANACESWRRAPTPEVVFDGIEDALAIASGARNAPNDITSELLAFTEALRDARAEVANASARQVLERLSTSAAMLTDIARTSALEDRAGANSALFWLEAIERTIRSHLTDDADSEATTTQLDAIATTARRLAHEMDFAFLLDPARKLLSIGYRATERQLDPSCYDLLASEARLASFVAIAKGDAPVRHWFRLGRTVTPAAGGVALISWSGSMFEYLMPSLVMRAPLDSLLEHTSRCVVRQQIAFGKRLGVPWGISESAYNVRDLELTYQYSSFGVPGLGYKRGLSENIVVAPYATGLAAMVDAPAAASNFRRLEDIGALGTYGFYEALDYTPARIPEAQPVAIVEAFMAHHQGMILVALADALHAGEMRTRFHAEPMIEATETLLQERKPREVVAAHPRAEEVKTAASVRDLDLSAPRRFTTPWLPTPETQLLSNGRYTVMLSVAGGGYSRWNGLAITRWREDPTRDDWGSWVYVRDVDSGALWSAGHQPIGAKADRYEVTFTEDRATVFRVDGDISTTLEVVVTTEDDAEVRRVTLANEGTRARELEVTSYNELVLAPPEADLSHPAFSKLFVQTDFVSRPGVLLATRRKRSPDEPVLWVAHFAVVEGDTVGSIEYETDRARFIGRGRNVHEPAATEGTSLSGTMGTVLDPIFALRRRVRIPPGGSARIAYWMVVADSRDALLDLVDKHHDATAFDRAATLAWTQAQVQLNHLGIDSDEARHFQRIAARLMIADPSLRTAPAAIARGLGPPPALWAHGISGDHPIVLVRIEDADDLTLVRQLLRAQEYWRMKQLEVDLVILNERGTSYVQDLQIALEELVRANESRPVLRGGESRGPVFVLRADLVSGESRAVLTSIARVSLHARHGSLAQQLARAVERADEPSETTAPSSVANDDPAPPPVTLELFNGIGGFDRDGREYVTVLAPGRTTPAPWINVVSNPSFGFNVSADGAGYTWSINSRENQLTAWSNDPVVDPSGEAIYLRDRESGATWSPTAAPIHVPGATYVARHGFGYSQFEVTTQGVASELVQIVAPDDPVKLSRLRVQNRSSRTRRLSVIGFVEWVLGPRREASHLSIVTECDATTGALLATNRWNATFGRRVAFFDLGGAQTSWTADRRSFLGHYGYMDRPAAVGSDAPLNLRAGAGLDACAALRTDVVVGPGESAEIVLLLGQGSSRDETLRLIHRYRDQPFDELNDAVRERWRTFLGKVRVETPDRATDLLLNGWALYQTLACRIWARSGFYQASGAYGFRDQLQDGMAIVHARPDLTRAHLLRAASRQFVEGDCQHWWLPPSGHGVRTRISDDRVWLAYSTQHYVDATADAAVLDEVVPFLEGPRLSEGAHDAFFQPQVADESETLYEHCARGLDGSLGVGAHGLPLIGTGDWNDGMNRVGEHGRGESVWLGWFLCATLPWFASCARARGDHTRAERWSAHADELRTALDLHGWDGRWYRRGYFDDGAPLGAAAAEECRIDSIAQSWSVLSGAGNRERARAAMHALQTELARPEDGLLPLLAPPFDRLPRDPGYIKGYPPGIRENGGQYTHAGAWAVLAQAQLGNGDEAFALFSYLNPIARTGSRAALQRYKVEPYAVAADVYTEAPHIGRGGWTWYTGAAGWLYRAGIEGLLGIRIRNDVLHVTPALPEHWPSCRVFLRHGSATYEVHVDNTARCDAREMAIRVDGCPVDDIATGIALIDDGQTHHIVVTLGVRA